MTIKEAIILICVLIVYASFLFVNLKNRKKEKEMQEVISIMNHESTMKCFQFETDIMRNLKISYEQSYWFLIIERVLLVCLLGVSIWFLKGLALLTFGSLAIIFLADDGYRKAIYKSGITNIGKVTNFINYFVPHINSGNSADQSLLGYIEYSKDEEIVDYYENKGNIDYEIPTHLKQIVEIYSIAKYNEEQGIADYTYILNELSQDMSQKQIYYNSFISRMGEIKPIMWSYYFGVPILIIVSYSQTADFWGGIGGYIVSIILLILFASFKFLIYKLQKNTVNSIF